jgi:hypothetical protein
MEADENQEKRRKHSEERASAAGHVLPGGWAPTPVEEVPEEHAVSLAKPDAHRGLNLDQHKEPGPVRDVASRVDSPELRAADERPRKSEAGVVGMIPPPPRSPSTPLLPQKHEGWVLVNVEGKKCPEEQCSENEHAIVRSPGVVRENGSANRRNIDKTSVEQVTMPAAKAIVMIDALDAKAKAKPGSGSDVIEEKGASAKNLFSMNRKTPVSSSDLEVSVKPSSTDPGRKGSGLEKRK